MLYQWKHGWKEKFEKGKDELKSYNQELKSDKYKLEDNLELAKRKVCEVILKGSFIEYIENTSDHVIVQIKNCCSAFLDGRCLWKRKERRGTEILVDLVRKDMKKIIDHDVSRNEKTKMLSNQQEGARIFSLLFGTVLPALVSEFVK